MNGNQLIIIAILVGALGLFLWGRWRHDLVALAALLACVIAGLVPAGEAFSGFGHPAVITVAAVLILGQGLQVSGAVNALARRLLPSGAGLTVSILSLVGLGAALSCFMNNVGALALLMPVAIQLAKKHDIPPGKFLMPLAAGSILGGMTTLIGTPPNLIVSGFRDSAGLGGFGMFDFTPVGLATAAAGVLLIGLVGWRLVPARKEAETGTFESGAYLSEVRIEEGSKAAGKSLREAEKLLEDAGGQIVGMVRGELRLSAPNRRRVLRVGDILVIEVEPESLSDALAYLGLKLEAEDTEDSEKKKKKKDQPDKKENGEEERPEEIVIQEVVVTPNAPLVNRSAADIRMRTRYGINLLAVSREGRRSVKRLRAISIRAGDLLLLQGPPEAISGFASEFGCLPLAARDIRVPRKGQALIAALIMAAAAAATTVGLLPAAVAFAAGALVMLAVKIVPARSVYNSIDWPVIILLGAMLPVAGAMETTGAAATLARFLLESLAGGNPVIALVVLLAATMILSDLMNNAATAAVMCPVALSAAAGLGANPDAFLMAVAVGASCAFLTPIGHQNNTLILGPGGFRFGDYWRLGMLVEIIVLAVAIPMILWVWPL